MKIFTFISIVFMLLIVFGVVYTQWETKNFVEGLPKHPPTLDSTEETQQAPFNASPDPVENTQQLQSEDERSRLSVESNSARSRIETSSQEVVNTEVPARENIKSQSNVYDWRDDDIHSHERLPQIDPWQSVEDRKTPKVNGPNITDEELRSQLVERFGDIPQVHTFIEFTQKRNQGAPLTVNEYIVYAESVNHLFPNRKTEQTIKRLKQIQQMQTNVNIIINQED